jgi:hypothetical protein
MEQSVARLARARRELGLSITELWWRYFALGGITTALELEAILYHALVPTVEDYDLLALALNERFSELGRDHPLPYSTDDDDA